MDKHQLPLEESYQSESNRPPNLADVVLQLCYLNHWSHPDQRHFTAHPADLQPRSVWHRLLKAALKQIHVRLAPLQMMFNARTFIKTCLWAPATNCRAISTIHDQGKGTEIQVLLLFSFLPIWKKGHLSAERLLTSKESLEWRMANMWLWVSRCCLQLWPCETYMTRCRWLTLDVSAIMG